ncbi:MAG: hypothetical protein EHM20_04065 [Alphaproteobacteria bacterium]|nr:MAG: hypothetical protein EHM20_04065 [Alphaproteobacteria bacterium]
MAKTEAIKGIFKSNCFSKDEGRMTEVLSSVKDIQDELRKRNMVDSNNPLLTNVGSNDSSSSNSSSVSGNTNSAENSTVSALSGIKFSSLFSNITTMIKMNQCNLDDGRVLSMTADLIYDSTQLGLLSGNELGLIVAGGGFIVSSALRLIDMIFKKKFDFDKNKDRQTFIKLNCSFYDIRKELEGQGVLDIENTFSREDLRDTKEMIEQVDLSLKEIEQDKINQKKSHELMDQDSLVALAGDIVPFKKNLLKLRSHLAAGIVDSVEIPSETQKLLMISKIAQNLDLIYEQLNYYRTLKLSSIPMLDDVFLMELRRFDQTNIAELNQVLNLAPTEFNDTVRARLLFHVIRILNDIGEKEQLASKQNEEIKKIKNLDLQKKQELYLSKLAELKKIEDRLNRIVSPRDYSGLDDGSDNMVSLIENYKNISEQIYGEWGDKFLSYSAQKSFDEAKVFNEKIVRFNKKYGARLKAFQVDKSPATYICQDIQRIRYSFKYADSLVQEGYDFVITNKDLFHSEARNYYNSELDEEQRSGASSVEKIQRHYKSTILAIKKLKNEEIDPGEEEKYLSRSLFGSSYLGHSMLDVSAARNAIRDIQDRFEQLNCQKILVDDLN